MNRNRTDIYTHNNNNNKIKYYKQINIAYIKND